MKEEIRETLKDILEYLEVDVDYANNAQLQTYLENLINKAEQPMQNAEISTLKEKIEELEKENGVVECWYCYKKHGTGHACSTCGREGR